jgi:uncharacterized membrane protein (UPF0127 family)
MIRRRDSHQLRRILDRDRREVICETCLLAGTPTARLKGLLGRRELSQGEGLLLRPSGAVHTCFMRFAIDIAFLDDELVVVDVVHRLRPWRLAARRGARAVLELAAGECERRGIGPDSRLMIEPAST